MSMTSPISLRIAAKRKHFETCGDSSYYYSKQLLANLSLLKAAKKLGLQWGWPVKGESQAVRLEQPVGSAFLAKSVQAHDHRIISPLLGLKATPIKKWYFAQTQFFNKVSNSRIFFNVKAVGLYSKALGRSLCLATFFPEISRLLYKISPPQKFVKVRISNLEGYKSKLSHWDLVNSVKGLRVESPLWKKRFKKEELTKKAPFALDSPVNKLWQLAKLAPPIFKDAWPISDDDVDRNSPELMLPNLYITKRAMQPLHNGKALKGTFFYAKDDRNIALNRRPYKPSCYQNLVYRSDVIKTTPTFYSKNNLIEGLLFRKTAKSAFKTPYGLPFYLTALEMLSFDNIQIIESSLALVPIIRGSLQSNHLLTDHSQVLKVTSTAGRGLVSARPRLYISRSTKITFSHYFFKIPGKFASGKTRGFLKARENRPFLTSYMKGIPKAKTAYVSLRW